MRKIVECVPNFSEGRRVEVVDELTSAISSVPGVTLLDKELNPDHNRAVITFIGPPEACAEAAFRATRLAAKLIDMNQHRGEHPRIGATDVIPFVPISGVTMEECVEFARGLGRRIAEELDIPVYLYEAAATRPDRVDLAQIRSGEFEGLREAIRTDPNRAPDFGPPRLHPTAGATVVGARFPLIAYNVNLASKDLEVAKEIARRVRFRDGGLRYVKALGFELKEEECVQVSMNLTNYLATPIYRAFEAVKREAERFGVTVRRSEIVGLVPQQALIDTAVAYLQLHGFRSDQILENRLIPPMSYSEFLDSVAAPTPTPGGGSVAALAGGLGVALLLMVCELSISRPGCEGKERFQEAKRRLGAQKERYLALVEEDARSFEAVMAAYRLPKETDGEKEERQRAIQEALKGACSPPLEVVELVRDSVSEGRFIAREGSGSSVSDVGVGGELLRAAGRGGRLNLLINLAGIRDEAWVKERLSQVEGLTQAIESGCDEIRQVVEERLKG